MCLSLWVTRKYAPIIKCTCAPNRQCLRPHYTLHDFVCANALEGTIGISMLKCFTVSMIKVMKRNVLQNLKIQEEEV